MKGQKNIPNSLFKDKKMAQLQRRIRDELEKLKINTSTSEQLERSIKKIIVILGMNTIALLLLIIYIMFIA